MNKRTKVKIYKIFVRLTTYAIETRADNKRTKRILVTTEIKILEYTLRHMKRNIVISHECKVEDIVSWGRKFRRDWNDHVDRMARERLAKIARFARPRT